MKTPYADPQLIERYAQAIELNPSLRTALDIRTTKYIPHFPSPKQRAFLMLPHREAFYGGAAGGGKSDALLMAALQYVDIPKYSAIIFRRTVTDSELSGAIFNRAKEWLGEFVDSKEVSVSGNAFHFPSGATLQFAYLANTNDKYRYQGAEFQYIAFDELTQFPEDDYLYLMSRLRRAKCPFHAGRVLPNETGEGGIAAPLPNDPNCHVCREFGPLAVVPLRMRAASNPGDNRGHLWVKKRFDIRPATQGVDAQTGVPIPRLYPNGKPMFVGHHPRRPFIPALHADNPYIDYAEYKESLSNLDPVTREQLLAGDWSVSADGRIKKAWARYYSLGEARNEAGMPEYVILGRGRKGPEFRVDRCHCFQIIDLSSSAKEGPGDEKIYTNRMPSWTVISTFLLTPTNDLVWWDIRRFRAEAPEIISIMRKQYKRHHPAFVGIEYTTQSMHFYQQVKRLGFPVKAFKPASQDKLSRAIPILNYMESGKVWLPEYSPWLEDLESELFVWVGHPWEQADQIDTLAYAGLYLSGRVAQDLRHTVHSYSPHTAIDNATPDVYDIHTGSVYADDPM